jgi:hypothetical protein
MGWLNDRRYEWMPLVWQGVLVSKREIGGPGKRRGYAADQKSPARAFS